MTPKVLIHLRSEIPVEKLAPRLRSHFKHVLTDEAQAVQFLAEQYFQTHRPVDQAALDEYLNARAGAVELILTDNIRSDTDYLRVIAVPGEGLIVDAEEEETVAGSSLLARLQSLMRGPML